LEIRRITARAFHRSRRDRTHSHWDGTRACRHAAGRWLPGNTQLRTSGDISKGEEQLYVREYPLAGGAASLGRGQPYCHRNGDAYPRGLPPSGRRRAMR
jgi:hypothetical protein